MKKKNWKKNIFHSYNSSFARPIFYFFFCLYGSTVPCFTSFFFSTIYWKIRNGFPTSWLFWNFWIEKLDTLKKISYLIVQKFYHVQKFFLKIVMIVVLLTDVHKFIFFVIRTTQKKRRMGRCLLMNFTNIFWDIFACFIHFLFLWNQLIYCRNKSTKNIMK